MKKMKKQLRIEKTTISRLANLNNINGGETIGTLEDCIISRYPNLCPPTNTCLNCQLSFTCPPPPTNTAGPITD